ncbi:hypothetical protein PRZ48_000563 [Zasmidium cellare]|uniref:non-specific serine/threonine protein kinase n=1 Tax=Zasmidium cellare TaxID=395010 RepID=A0ABR0F051_ZASCE|nr:hypothetical protein PRZ48_000563 [Zasmidium cellare]
MDPRIWSPDWAPSKPRRAASPHPYDGIALKFPAEISIRAAPRLHSLDNRRHNIGSRGSQTPPTDPSYTTRRPPYPITPHMPRMTVPESPQPRMIEPRGFLPGHMRTGSMQTGSTRSGSTQTRPFHQEHAFQPTHLPQPKHGFVLLPDDPVAQDEQHSKRLVTNEAEFLIIRPLRGGSSRYTNHDLDHFLIEDVRTKELFVQKRWTLSTDPLRKRSVVENKALRQITQAGPSPHIISIFETFVQPASSHCSMIIDYCDSGTLGDFINRYIQEGKSTPEPFAWQVLSSLASALSMCHYGISDATQSVVTAGDWTTLYHFDVQPINIWLSSPDTNSAYPRVVLGNFSCVSRRAEIESGEAVDILQRHGTSVWLPPEARGEQAAMPILSEFTDIWQAGAVIQAMCCLIRMPDIAQAENPCGSQYSFTLNNIIACCMNSDWLNRPTAVDLVREIGRHPSQQKAECQIRY